MMRIPERFRSAGGFSLIELIVGAAVAAIATAIVVAWIVAATRVDLDQENEFEGLNELRNAKAVMTKEVRFADGSLIATNPDSVEVWVDLDDSGTGPDSTGEHVIWRILTDDLVRYTDNDLTTSVTWVEDLVAAESSIAVTGTVVDIQLAVAVAQGAVGVPNTRTIKTSVTMRNG